jgi:hypothetical protein
VICGDTDDAGKKHVELVFESIAGKVGSHCETARISQGCFRSNRNFQIKR